MRISTSIVVVVLATSLPLAHTAAQPTPQSCELGMLRGWEAEDEGIYPDLFGASLAIDGDRIVVGAPRSHLLPESLGNGGAFVFQRHGAQWFREGILAPIDASRVGESVDIDGGVIVVRARGSAYVYRYFGGMWRQEARLTAQDVVLGDAGGKSVAVSGETVVVGHPDSFGSSGNVAVVFERLGTGWIERQPLIPTDRRDGQSFGWSVSVNARFAVIGAPGDDELGDRTGAAYVFERIADEWVHEAKLTASDASAFDAFGSSVAIDGNLIVVGAPGHRVPDVQNGTAYVFRFNGTGWSEEARLYTSSAPYFLPGLGKDVGLFGEQVILGATGSAHLFTRVGAEWVEASVFENSADSSLRFGLDVAIGETEVAVGADLFDHGDHVSVGAVFLYGSLRDCDASGRSDICEISDGVRADCTGNAIPDMCEPDCNDNGDADSCDIVDGIDTDCNHNDILDGCEEIDDADGDGTADCADGCPNDPAKIDPGPCGCGYIDDDRDDDGTADCLDGCPDDPDKAAPDVCGCGEPDVDLDGDGVEDCSSGIVVKAVKLNPTCIDGPKAGEPCARNWDCYNYACGPDMTPRHHVIVRPGDTIVAEFYASQWSIYELPMYGWNFVVDSRGYFSGESGQLVPVGWDKISGPPWCTSDDECPAEYVCEIGCNGPGHEPFLGAFVDADRPDYVFSDSYSAFAGIDPSASLDYRYGGAVVYSSDSVAYEWPPKYLATLALTVSDDAAGDFQINLLRPQTYFALGSVPNSLGVQPRVVPLKITVVDHICGDGVCEPAEDEANCYEDCHVPVCGDGVCEEAETEDGCPLDCVVSYIPAVSAWGVLVMALFTLVVARLTFGRPIRAD